MCLFWGYTLPIRLPQIITHKFKQGPFNPERNKATTFRILLKFLSNYRGKFEAQSSIFLIEKNLTVCHLRSLKRFNSYRIDCKALIKH